MTAAADGADPQALAASMGVVPGVASAAATIVSDGAPWRASLVVHVDLDPAVADEPRTAVRGVLAVLASAGAALPPTTVAFSTHRPHEEPLDARRVAAAAGLPRDAAATRRSLVVDAAALRGLAS